MSVRYSIAQRTPSLNGLFASLACAITLTLTVGPALAQPADLERVEVKGHVIEAPARHDVLAACPDLATRLPGALDRAWHVHGRYGEVKVQFVMDNGAPEAVQAKGVSNLVAREVRNAVSRLDCGPQAVACARAASTAASGSARGAASRCAAAQIGAGKWLSSSKRAMTCQCRCGTTLPSDARLTLVGASKDLRTRSICVTASMQACRSVSDRSLNSATWVFQIRR